MPINKYIGTLVAIGLFDAGLLGAICISLASLGHSVKYSDGHIP